MSATLKKFQSLKGIKKGCGQISTKGLKNMIQKFEETGSFEVTPGRGRKSIASTSVVVQDVASALKEETSSGVETCRASGIARCLDMPTSMMHNIMRNILHYYPYKITLVHELLPADLPRREAFALEFLARI